MNLEEYLKPLIDLHGAGYVKKYLGISYQALSQYYEKGLPLSEGKEPKKIRLLVKLAKKNKQTDYISTFALKSYINNPRGSRARKMTQKLLKELVEYNPETGDFFRKYGEFKGEKIGYIQQNGGILLSIKSEIYAAHRLAWLYMTGDWPQHEIDHINHNRSDNRFSNLRDVTHQENCRNKPLVSNNTSGINGVYFNKKENRWSAAISIGNGEMVYLGSYDDIEDAARARKKADKKYGFHENHGNKRPEGE